MHALCGELRVMASICHQRRRHRADHVSGKPGHARHHSQCLRAYGLSATNGSGHYADALCYLRSGHYADALC